MFGKSSRFVRRGCWFSATLWQFESCDAVLAAFWGILSSCVRFEVRVFQCIGKRAKNPCQAEVLEITQFVHFVELYFVVVHNVFSRKESMIGLM